MKLLMRFIMLIAVFSVYIPLSEAVDSVLMETKVVNKQYWIKFDYVSDVNKTWDGSQCVNGRTLLSLHYKGIADEGKKRKGYSCKVGESSHAVIVAYINSLGGVNKWINTNLSGLYNYPICLASGENSDILLDCGVKTVSNKSCSYEGANLTFEHPAVDVKNVNNSVVSKSTQVTCDDTVDVLFLVGNNIGEYTGITLASDGSLLSDITVNGKIITATGTLLSFASGVNKLTISSNLRGNGSVKAGKYTANGVMLLQVQ